MQTYDPPIDKLLSLGQPRQYMPPWPDYRQHGISPEHIPELIRLGTDLELYRSGEEPQAYGVVHAWRALGHLRAESAIQPLLDVLAKLDVDDDDWSAEDIPEALAMIGPAALPALKRFSRTLSHGQFVRMAAANGMCRMPTYHPGTYNDCFHAVLSLLRDHANNEPDLNALLIAELLELEDPAAVPLMKEAFLAGDVDESIVDWSDVRERLDLPRSPDDPPEIEPIHMGFVPTFPHWGGPERPPRSADRQRQKSRTKRKRSRKSRKQNRRK